MSDRPMTPATAAGRALLDAGSDYGGSVSFEFHELDESGVRDAILDIEREAAAKALADAVAPRERMWSEWVEMRDRYQFWSDHFGAWPHEYGPKRGDGVDPGVHRDDCRGCALNATMALAAAPASPGVEE